MLRKYNNKTIPTFGLMSKCIKHYYLLKVQLHRKSKKKSSIHRRKGANGMIDVPQIILVFHVRRINRKKRNQQQDSLKYFLASINQS